MRNLALESRIRRRLVQLNRPASFYEIHALFPKVPYEVMNHTFASMVARGSVAEERSEDGVARYRPSSKWGGRQS